MNKSLTNDPQMEQQLNATTTAHVPTSSQPLTKPYVIGSFVVPADYDEGPECEDDGCEFCNDIHCGRSCQEEDW